MHNAESVAKYYVIVNKNRIVKKNLDYLFLNLARNKKLLNRLSVLKIILILHLNF